MALFKCKMCGGALEIASNTTVITCEYCGTQQTLPKLDDDKCEKLYDRANHFRRNNEFDKAMGVYEQILNEDNTDAEVYWSLVLCRYGIEYVEDPSSHKHIPTVNRAQFTSIFDDDNYKSALQYADSFQRHLYEQEATAINEIQKGILAISQQEEPFDVFICYKESDSQGRRTRDSVLAQELYYQLKQEGFKVFFSRITLEDKLGSAYEPYIFAALNSAKVMVVVGTKPEFFDSVWVKNEWSRYLSLIKQGQKKVLIPAYRDMDPYDLPVEFSHLQAQDMSKLGFMQDLIRGIKKIIGKDKKQATPSAERVTPISEAQNTAPLIRRAFLFLEDGAFANADEYAEKVLDIYPECAEAYIIKLLIERKLAKTSDLGTCSAPLSDSNNYQKAIRFATPEYRETLEGYNIAIIDKIEEARKDSLYSMGLDSMNRKQYDEAIQCFQQVARFRDAGQKLEECKELKAKLQLAENLRLAKEKRIAEEKRLAEQALAAEQARIKEEQNRARAAKFAEERRLADEKIEAERKIVAQKNKVSHKFILFAILISIAIIVVGAITEFIYGIVVPSEGYSPLFNAFMSVFAYVLIMVPVAILPNAFALLSMIISQKAKKTKIAFAILAFITAAPAALFLLILLLAMVVAYDPEVLGIAIAFGVAGLLDILACIYLIVLPFIIKSKNIT